MKRLTNKGQSSKDSSHNPNVPESDAVGLLYRVGTCLNDTGGDSQNSLEELWIIGSKRLNQGTQGRLR